MTDNSARKDDKDKPRYSLIPPDALQDVAQLYTDGAAKYGDRNWEKGMDWCRVYDALQRHAQKWLSGQDLDDDDPVGSRQPHMASVAWCALTLLVYHKRGVGVDDRLGSTPGVLTGDKIEPINAAREESPLALRQSRTGGEPVTGREPDPVLGDALSALDPLPGAARSRPKSAYPDRPYTYDILAERIARRVD